MKHYTIKTVYRDGVTTFDMIEGNDDMPAPMVFDLHLMSSKNTDEDTVSMSMTEVEKTEVLASYNFPI